MSRKKRVLCKIDRKRAAFSKSGGTGDELLAAEKVQEARGKSTAAKKAERGAAVPEQQPRGRALRQKEKAIRQSGTAPAAYPCSVCPAPGFLLIKNLKIFRRSYIIYK